MGLNWMCFRGFGGVPPIDMPSSAEGQVVSEQGVVCGAHLPEEAPPFGRGVSLHQQAQRRTGGCITDEVDRQRLCPQGSPDYQPHRATRKPILAQGDALAGKLIRNWSLGPG